MAGTLEMTPIRKDIGAKDMPVRFRAALDVRCYFCGFWLGFIAGFGASPVPPLFIAG